MECLNYITLSGPKWLLYGDLYSNFWKFPSNFLELKLLMMDLLFILASSSGSEPKLPNDRDRRVLYGKKTYVKSFVLRVTQ